MAAFLKSRDAARMDPVLRMLLASDGTITSALHALLLTLIGVEVVHQTEMRLDAATAGFLDAEPGSNALSREAWLTADGQRRVHASSIILLETLDRSLLQAFQSRHKPLGLLLQESGRTVTRDRLQIGCLSDPEAIKTLGSGIAGPIWMRRYRMSLGSKAAAFIQEQFIGPPFRP